MRQFLCGSFPDDSGKIIVKDRNYRYLVKVLRFSEGDKLDARLPDGQLVQLYVEKILQSSAILRLALPESSLKGTQNGTKTTQGVKSADVQSVAEKFPELWLFQFLPKPQKMDLIVRQATECGIKRIIPIAGDFSVKNDSAGRIERWERIIREARQQSGSGVATEISDVMAVGAAAELWKKHSETASSNTATYAFLLDENPSSGKSCLSGIDKQSVSAAALAVGCEGGISDEERKTLFNVGFMPLHFTTNVLRAETAAIYGIAVIQQFFSAE